MYFKYLAIIIAIIVGVTADLLFSQSIFLSIFSLTAIVACLYWQVSSKSWRKRFTVALVISLVYGFLLNLNLAIIILPLMIMELVFGLLAELLPARLQNLGFSLGFFMIYNLLYLNLANLDLGHFIFKVLLNTVLAYIFLQLLAKIVTRNNKYHKFKNANFRY